MKIIFVIIAILPAIITNYNLNAQQIENLAFRQEGVNVIITYDLFGGTEYNYFITVFSSHNDYNKALKSVTGDVGEEISPGSGKIITWEARQELGDYKGNISFKIKARLVPIIEFTNLTASYRRGISYQVRWKTGTSQDYIQFQLYKGDKIAFDLGQIPNTGSWNWHIPKNQYTGKGFRFKAIALNKVAYSADFRINPKTPRILLSLPFSIGIAILGVVILNKIVK